MAVGGRCIDVEKSLKEAQDATRVGALAPEIDWIGAAAAVELIKHHFKNSAFDLRTEQRRRTGARQSEAGDTHHEGGMGCVDAGVVG